MQNGIERRRHQRKQVPESVLIESPWRAVNLSESGMLLASKTELKLGSRIQLKLDLKGERLDYTAVVKRCMPSPSVYEQEFHVGVQFDDSTASRRLIIRRYLNPDADES